MPIDPGLGTVSSSKGFQRFFNRWGTSGQLRSLWNFVVPVAVVDRYRSDEEGSLRGITMQSDGAANEYSSCWFGSNLFGGESHHIIEVHKMYAARMYVLGWNVPHTVELHLFTAVLPYNPILNINPLGYYLPGLFTDPSFSVGYGIGFGGSNPALPPDIGYQLANWYTGGLAAGRWSPFLHQHWNFDPPIRLFPGHGLAIQCRTLAPVATTLRATVMYTETYTTEGIT